MFSSIFSFLVAQPLAAVGGSLAVVLLGWLLKTISNSKIKDFTGKFFYGLGATITLGLSKWKWSKPVWNKIVEPFVIDLIDNVLVNGLQELIKGMRSDNS